MKMATPFALKPLFKIHKIGLMCIVPTSIGLHVLALYWSRGPLVGLIMYVLVLLSVYVSRVSSALCSNNSPAANMPQRAAVCFLSSYDTKAHSTWYKHKWVSLAGTRVGDDVQNGGMESAYVTAEDKHIFSR